MQSFAKSTMRTVKSYSAGYSNTQVKVREATSNDPWGPSGTQMSEIAQLTHNQSDFVEIMEMLDKRLNDKGKNWRHVFKSLTLLDYILHAGSPNCVLYFKENLYIIKTLKEFQYIDEDGKDQGANVRQKAKDITNLLLDESRMKSQRKSRANMKDRLNGEGDRDEPPRRRERTPPPRRTTARGGEDSELAAAIEASKRSAADDSKRTQTGDADLEEAMRLSREEDERRRRELGSQSDGNLFDEPSNNLIDIDPGFQQPMQTGMPFSSFNPYAQQQQQQQEEWARQQQMAELQRQAEEMAYLQNQQMLAQQQMAQEEYMRQQQQLQYQQQQQYLQQQQYQQQQPLVPQPTAYGSNNPFAAFAPPTPVAATPPPPLPQATYVPPPSPAAQTPVRVPRDDGKHTELARMLAGGREDGLDTFGNIGNMRMPAQFGARPGALNAQATGARPNPFGTFTDSFGTSQQSSQQQQQPKPAESNQPFFTL